MVYSLFSPYQYQNPFSHSTLPPWAWGIATCIPPDLPRMEGVIQHGLLRMRYRLMGSLYGTITGQIGVFLRGQGTGGPVLVQRVVQCRYLFGREHLRSVLLRCTDGNIGCAGNLLRQCPQSRQILPDKLPCLRVFLQLVLSEIDAVFHTESPLDPMCAGGQGQRPPIRKMDVCCDVTGNREFVSDRISLIPPAALNASHRRIVNGFGVP